MLVVLHLPEIDKFTVTLTFFCLAVATLAFVAGYAAARFQSFRKLGLLHQHVSYTTVGVQLDMSSFQDNVLKWTHVQLNTNSSVTNILYSVFCISRGYPCTQYRVKGKGPFNLAPHSPNLMSPSSGSGPSSAASTT